MWHCPTESIMIFHQYVSFEPMQRLYTVLCWPYSINFRTRHGKFKWKRNQKRKSGVRVPVYNSAAHPCGGKGMVDPPGQEQELGTWPWPQKLASTLALIASGLPSRPNRPAQVQMLRVLRLLLLRSALKLIVPTFQSLTRTAEEYFGGIEIILIYLK